uniref:Potassium channel subfamily K member 4 n=1 Tax=Oryzias latipes TaxID=8090 RepID=A0A3P9H2N0_ORYLA
MRCSTLLAIFVGVLLYLVLGAVVFRTLEIPNERKIQEESEKQLSRVREHFLGNFSCVEPESLMDFLQKVEEVIEGLGSSSNETSFTKWDLASAFFFSGTIITTIGFGNISPQTDGGKLFCIFYALVGIPMFGILLAGVGDHLGTVLRKAIAKIELLFLKWKVSPTIVRVISAILSILLGCLVFVAVPILVFQEVEGWTLLDSAYFVVITLTTVGFGDYVAADTEEERSQHWYKPLVWFWILVGLAYFASILTMIGNWLRVLSKKTRAEVLPSFFLPSSSFPTFTAEHRYNCVKPFLPDGGAACSCQRLDSEYPEHATQTDRVPEDKPAEFKKEEEPPSDPQLSHYFGENLAFIDESSDAQSGKLKTDSRHGPNQPNSRPTKRRRHRRHIQRRGSRTSNHNRKQPNGNPKPAPDLKPQEETNINV